LKNKISSFHLAGEVTEAFTNQVPCLKWEAGT